MEDHLIYNCTRRYVISYPAPSLFNPIELVRHYDWDENDEIYMISENGHFFILQDGSFVSLDAENLDRDKEQKLIQLLGEWNYWID